jgi:hypothetical protein
MLYNPYCNDYDAEVNEDIFTESDIVTDKDNSEADDIDIGSQDTIISRDDEESEEDSEDLSIMNTKLNAVVMKTNKQNRKRKYRLKQIRVRKSKIAKLNEAIESGVRRKVSEVALEAKVIAGKRRVVKPNRVRFASKESKENPLIAIHKLYGHLSESRIKLAYKKNLIQDDRYCYEDIKDLHLPICPRAG